MIILKNEREILPYDKDKPQILDSNNIVENMFLAVGFASRCWKGKNGTDVFDTESAIRIANELCAYVRILTEKQNNLDYLEWKYEQKNKKV